MMEILPYIGAILGGTIGFIGGVAVLAYITRGHKTKELMEDKDKKIWLGLFGWLFAAAGTYCGWQFMFLLTH